MDTEAKYPIYVGVWTNWSRGAVLGATLTLDQGNAALLIAFVAFFVAWVGTRCWRLMCLAIHFMYSSSEPRDALHHQRQAVLRNSSNPESGLVILTYLAWAWRKNSDAKPYLRLVGVIATALVFAAGFTAASGFSSQISGNLGYEVLLDGSNCAAVNFSALSFNDQVIDQQYRVKLTKNWANYAQQCYASTVEMSRLLGCGAFVQQRLRSDVWRNASCPFHPSMCKSQDRNLLIDTGYLDSHDDFGINAPPQERFQLRRVVHCAPLVTEGRTAQFNLSAERSYTRYNYGKMWTTVSNDTARIDHGNFTYEHSNDAVNDYLFTKGQSALEDYSITPKPVYYSNGEPAPDLISFMPGPELDVDGADLALYFLAANGILFQNMTNDPWYEAQVSGFNVATGEVGEDGELFQYPVYQQNQAASPLGCKTQHQLCNPSLPEASRCAPLSSFVDFTQAAIDTVFANQEGGARRMDWLYNAAITVTPLLPDTVMVLGSQSLLSRQRLVAGIQAPLPDNQWMLDVEYWHNISLASIQGSFVTAVTGPSDPAVLPWVNRTPNNTEERSLCNNQKILSKAYISFSLFGLLFIFIFGSTTVIISFTVDPILSVLRKRYGVKPYQQLEWRTNDALQLQRLAHEEVGAGTWYNGDEIIPLTQPGQDLASLDISNPSHPKLYGQSNSVSPYMKQNEGKNLTLVRTAEVRDTGGSNSRNETSFNARDDTSPIDGTMTDGSDAISVPATSPTVTNPTSSD